MPTGQTDKQFRVSALALVIVHTAGIIGLHTAYRDFFLLLTPVNLIFSASLLLFSQREFNLHFIIFCLLVLIGGYFIEVIGVQTGIIFGSYTYNDSLGRKLLGVPLVIGVNWLMLVYSAGVISNKIKVNIFLKSGIGALLLVGLDLFIEQNAHRYGFWSWMYNVIPLRNYIAWFIVSFVFLLLFHSLKFNKENKLAVVLYSVQLVFFVLLCIL